MIAIFYLKVLENQRNSSFEYPNHDKKKINFIGICVKALTATAKVINPAIYTILAMIYFLHYEE